MAKAFRIIGIVLVAIILGGAIMSSMVKPSNAGKIWDTAMTKGNPDAKNYFIVYSDIMCPYCIAFENAILENEEEFEKYIEENDILFEVRLSDFLYRYGQNKSELSKYSAEATYCAKNEGKFWDYYSLAVKTIWNDYFKNSGKSAFSQMDQLTKQYWIDLGKEIGLGENFEDCVNNDVTLAEADANAEKSSRLISGMPYFQFNNYITSGFDLSWGWEYVLMYFEAGLDR